MRKIQRLVRNGNSTHVAIPREALHYLGWKPGDHVLIELTETKAVCLRRINIEGIKPIAMPRVHAAEATEATR